MTKSWATSTHKKILSKHKEAYLSASGEGRKAILSTIKAAIWESGGKRVPSKLTKVFLHDSG
jgi:hypothetical protein